MILIKITQKNTNFSSNFKKYRSFRWLFSTTKHKNIGTRNENIIISVSIILIIIINTVQNLPKIYFIIFLILLIIIYIHFLLYFNYYNDKIEYNLFSINGFVSWFDNLTSRFVTLFYKLVCALSDIEMQSVATTSSMLYSILESNVSDVSTELVSMSLELPTLDTIHNSGSIYNSGFIYNPGPIQNPGSIYNYYNGNSIATMSFDNSLSSMDLSTVNSVNSGVTSTAVTNSTNTISMNTISSNASLPTVSTLSSGLSFHESAVSTSSQRTHFAYDSPPLPLLFPGNDTMIEVSSYGTVSPLTPSSK